jgi:pyrophosphatase PpaX
LCANRDDEVAVPFNRPDTIACVQRETVLFDFDGTLVDSGAMILASFRHATETVLARKFSDAELLAYVGGPHLRAQMSEIDPDRVEELVEAYREHNEPLHAGLLAFDGIVEVLERLRADGHRLGIVTSKRRVTVELGFEVQPLEGYFDVLVTSDDTERHKPFPDPILRALDALGTSPAQAAYVGDSPFDVRAAKSAGVLAVAVSWGGIHARQRLEAEHPDAIVDRPEELLDVV